MRPFTLQLAALTLAVLALVSCDRSPAAAATDTPATQPSQRNEAMVRVRVFNKEGQLVGPVDSPKVVKTDAEWKKQLTPEQYKIVRAKGTERAFCGTLLDNHKEGVYTCVACGLPLFSSDSKFQSGTGWPSFFQPVAKENVAEIADDSYGMRRVEILCARCGGHLGHVFEDGPRPTGLRFCLNSESLAFTEKNDLKKLADPAAESGAATQPAASGATSTKAAAVFAGGCFWCTEAVFQQLNGVSEVESGYAGGTKETAHYKTVCGGNTGHAEVIRITYDPSVISFDKLLDVFFAAHDPTTLNRQGADQGTQYRSAIFYANDAEKTAAAAKIKQLNAAKAFRDPIVTSLEPLKEFFVAEDYHQDYAELHPDQPYIACTAIPHVTHVRKTFPELLKK